MGFFSFLKKKEKPIIPKFEPLNIDLEKPPLDLKSSTLPPSTPEFSPEITKFDQLKIPETTRLSFQEPPQKEITPRDIELIFAKLETIKVMIENLSHRIERIEQQQKERIKW